MHGFYRIAFGVLKVIMANSSQNIKKILSIVSNIQR